MTRGEVWTVAGGADYAGKPRPAVIIQDDRFDATRSITICAFTTNPTEAPLFRVAIDATPENGLLKMSRAMVDKIATVSKAKLGTRLGRLSEEDLLRLNRTILVFLGLAGSTRNRRA